MSRHAIVAGAGIGGLTAAVALRRRGWDVTVLERAQALEPVGAGLGLGPNALHALDAIGLGDEVRRFSAVQGHGGLRRPGGGWLVRTDLGGLAARFGDPQLVALRADVVDLLAGRLPAGVLRTGVTVTGVDAGDADRRARVATSAGDLDADLVVAADGIGSRIRATLFPDSPGPRYSGFTTWRFVAPAATGGRRPGRARRDVGEGRGVRRPPAGQRPGVLLRQRTRAGRRPARRRGGRAEAEVRPLARPDPRPDRRDLPGPRAARRRLLDRRAAAGLSPRPGRHPR